MAKRRKEAQQPKIYDEVTLQLSDAVKQISQIANVPSNMPENPKIQSPAPRSYPIAPSPTNNAQMLKVNTNMNGFQVCNKRVLRKILMRRLN